MFRKGFYTGTFLLLIIIAFLSLCSCSRSQEDAKNELQKLNIDFNEKSFVDSAFYGNRKAVELFLKAGMNPNVIITNKNGINLSALSAACVGGHVDTVKYLIGNGADVNPNFQNGMPVLISALWIHKVPESNVKNIVSMLLEKGVNINVSWKNKSAIDYARDRGSNEIVEILMSGGEKKHKNITSGSLASNDASPDQYKEVALRYLRALSQGDFETYMQLDLRSRDRLATLQVPEQPAFDRQQRMQDAMNEVKRQIRDNFNTLYLPGDGGVATTHGKVYRLRGATFRVIDVGPIKQGMATVYIEAQGREKNIFVVPVLYNNGNWGVHLDSIGIHGKTFTLQ
jgi:hypothetical protein